MMKENMKYHVVRAGILWAGVFSLLSTSTAIAKSITQYQTLFQEKFIYITLSLVFFFLIHHKIRSRVFYAFLTTGEGGEKKNEKRDSTHSCDTSSINSSSERNTKITKHI
jgi:hypothetical protein